MTVLTRSRHDKKRPLEFAAHRVERDDASLATTVAVGQADEELAPRIHRRGRDGNPSGDSADAFAGSVTGKLLLGRRHLCRDDESRIFYCLFRSRRLLGGHMDRCVLEGREGAVQFSQANLIGQRQSAVHGQFLLPRRGQTW